jgi:sterol desaturase/sphingolipid hydroxylase (fatty acid hydroxylase superfamily)
MQAAYKSIRLFNNGLLEWFSHIHPLTPLLVWGPVAVALIGYGASAGQLGLGTMAGLGLSGLLVWSLAEYVLHRYVFHFKPRHPWQERLVFIMHGIHHADPMDPTRLVMTPTVALVLALIFYPTFRGVFGLFSEPLWVNPFFGFFILGYLTYDYTHYSVHHFTPRTRWGKALKQNHMLHHFVNQELRWGVSTPLWDWVFGTYHEPVPVKKSHAKKAKPQPAAAGLVTEGLKRSIGKQSGSRKSIKR